MPDGYATISDIGFIDGLLWPSEWGASGTLKIVSDVPFVAKDGKVFPSGKKTDRLTDGWCVLSDIVVTDDVPVFDNFTLPQTDNLVTPIGDGSEPRYSGFYYDENGTYRGTLFSDCNLSASLGASLNFQAWMNDVAQMRPPPGDTSPTTGQMNVAIEAALYAPASTTQLGIIEVVPAPIDPARPKALGANSPFVPRAKGTATLVPDAATVQSRATVLSADVEADSAIIPFSQSPNVGGSLFVDPALIVAGVSFVIASTNVGDAGQVGWILI